jgi:hypothetical protein
MKKQHVLFSNYHWENDEHGKDHYDYAREEIWYNDEEHRFTDADYTDNQLSMEGLETYTCPICGEEFGTLEEAKECCRDDKWETPDDIPDNEVTDFVYSNEEWEWDDKHGWKVRPFVPKSADDIRKGNFKLPDDKPLKSSAVNNRSTSANTEDIIDGDLPF